jgi:hypothetical protein
MARCPRPRIAGGAEESICQPEWSPDNLLHFVSDRSGWWNLYRLCRDRQRTEGLCPMEAEFATPHWTFGNSMYGFRSASEIICTYIDKGVSHLARLPGSGKLECIANPYEEIRELRVGAGYIAMLAGSPTIPMELARIDFTEEGVESSRIDRAAGRSLLSIPTSISYPSQRPHGARLLLPAAQPDVQAPAAASRP